MYTAEMISPNLYAINLQKNPSVFLVQPWMQANDLGGIDIGKFASRIFDFNAWAKKAPRTIAGAASGYFAGGGWTGAIAGAGTAAAFRRRAGTSLFQDFYRGTLYGAAGGSVVGVFKETVARPYFGYRGPSGYAGYATRRVKQYFFPAPTGTMKPTASRPVPTLQYKQPIGPGLETRVPTKVSTPEADKSWWEKKAFTEFWGPLATGIIGGVARAGQPAQQPEGEPGPGGGSPGLPGPTTYPGGGQGYPPGYAPGGDYGVEYGYGPGGEYIPGGGYGGGFPTEDWIDTEEGPVLSKMGMMKRAVPYVVGGGVGLAIIWALWR